MKNLTDFHINRVKTVACVTDTPSPQKQMEKVP